MERGSFIGFIACVALGLAVQASAATATFEDLTLDRVYTPDETFVSGDTSFKVITSPTAAPGSQFQVRVRPTFPFGQELLLWANAGLELTVPGGTTSGSFRFSSTPTNFVLTINGVSSAPGMPGQLNGAQLGGVTISTSRTFLQHQGKSYQRDFLLLSGAIQTLKFTGHETGIDDVTLIPEPATALLFAAAPLALVRRTAKCRR